MIDQKDIQAFRDTGRVLLRGNDFIYLLPHQALRGYISNYTVTFPGKGVLSGRYTVLPHGSATLVFSQDGRGWHGELFGPLTKPCPVGARANQCALLLIVEFQPAGLYALAGLDQKELADRIFPLSLVAPALNRLLLQALESAGDLADWVGRLDRHLWENLSVSYPAALQNAVKMTVQSAGGISTKDLSAAVYYSQRHLGRIFETCLGMNVKTFSRLVRVNKAIRLLRRPRCSAACACRETGFYDLPHFIHDFQSVCGLTPRQYRDHMSDFYNEIAKF